MINVLFRTAKEADDFMFETSKTLHRVGEEIFATRNKQLQELPEFGPHSWLLSDHSRRALQRSTHEQWWYNFVEETISSTKPEDMPSSNSMGSNVHWLFYMIIYSRLNSLYASKIESWKHITMRPMWDVPKWVSKAMDNGLEAIVLSAIHRHWGINPSISVDIGSSLFDEGFAEISIGLKAENVGYTVAHIPFKIPGKGPDECNIYWRDILWSVVISGDNSGFDIIDSSLLKNQDDFDHHWAVKVRD